MIALGPGLRSAEIPVSNPWHQGYAGPVARRSGGRVSRSDEPEPSLTVPRDQLLEALEDRIAQGQELLSQPVASEEDLLQARRGYSSWDEYNDTLLRRSFTSSRVSDEYSGRNASFIGSIGGDPDPLDVRIDSFRGRLSGKIRKLQSFKEQLPLYELGSQVDASAAHPVGVRATGDAVFLVHGHNGAAKEEVARFVGRITGAEVTILHEQANRGRTVIEKFEDVSQDVGFAVVLLTADDEGGVRGTGELSARARQNVVFELGFFISAIGRSRVAVLHEEAVELPSDMSGILYTALDSAGGWKLEVARELRAAGIRVDLEKAL